MEWYDVSFSEMLAKLDLDSYRDYAGNIDVEELVSTVYMQGIKDACNACGKDYNDQFIFVKDN